jgi:two-component system sensor histidine kinase KdpD
VLVAQGLQKLGAEPSIPLAFLTAVLASGALWGLFPSLAASVVGMLAYDFFFLPPFHSFMVANPENFIALAFFLIAAVIAGNLAAAVRAQAITARLRARTTEDLYQFSRKLAGPPPTRSPRC